MSVSGYDTRFILVSALQFERFIFEGLFPNTLLIKKKVLQSLQLIALSFPKPYIVALACLRKLCISPSPSVL